MKRRICEWGSIISLLMTLALATLWADSLLTRQAQDVIFSLGSNLKVFTAEGCVTLFDDRNERGTMPPRVFRPNAFGVPNERRHIDWRICRLVSGAVTPRVPPGSRLPPRTSWYTEFTIPGLSFHRDGDSSVRSAHWSLRLTLGIPIMLSMIVMALFGRRLRELNRPPHTRPPAAAP